MIRISKGPGRERRGRGRGQLSWLVGEGRSPDGPVIGHLSHPLTPAPPPNRGERGNKGHSLPQNDHLGPGELRP